ncbi:MAG TPA: hypothetical protein VF200_08985 [Woeseiaceae bacterium]
MIGSLFVFGAAILLSGYALGRRDGTFTAGLQRARTEFVKLTPRLLSALVAAGFAVKLLPTELITQFLGPDSGATAIIISSAAGLVIPAGPVVVFAVSASFAEQGASVPALVSFITGWSVFALHRVAIFELPMLGSSFVRMRLMSVAVLPPLAGLLAMGLLELLDGPAG